MCLTSAVTNDCHVAGICNAHCKEWAHTTFSENAENYQMIYIFKQISSGITTTSSEIIIDLTMTLFNLYYQSIQKLVSLIGVNYNNRCYCHWHHYYY